ncbi:MAG: deoxyribodipyrimidine photo-lyase [Sphingobacterium sp.]
MSKKVVLVWFRNDLRLHDNEVLVEAINKSDLIIPVFCFDPRYFGKNEQTLYHTGVKRAHFLRSAVRELKTSLQSMNSDLMTYVGFPEEILPKLCAKYEVTEVYHHREVARRETAISELVEEALWDIKINLRHFIGHTLYHKEDLPFPIKDIPERFNLFRKKIERESLVRPFIERPDLIPSPQHLESTMIPTLEELGYTKQESKWAESQDSPLGEKQAISRLRRLLSPDYTGASNYTFISPYIASGSLSPLFVYHQMQNSSLVNNKPRHDHLLTMLLWRDYFRFMLKKHPDVFFKPYGFSERSNPDFGDDELKIQRWMNADTGQEEIDHTIRTLKEVGNITYVERQLISAYFSQEISNNWLVGAAFFEQHLLDFAPATTYGFWSHIAGVGTSQKENNTLDWRDYSKKILTGKT